MLTTQRRACGHPPVPLEPAPQGQSPPDPAAQMLKDWLPPPVLRPFSAGLRSGSQRWQGKCRAGAASAGVRNAAAIASSAWPPTQDPSTSEPTAPTSAAIFDLDRTLLSGASGPIIGEALRHVGLLTTPSRTLESMAFGLFNLIGETWPSMLLTRQGARAARGWSVDLVRAAADRAAEPLAEAVLPYAQQMIAEHRSQGRVLVMATTTPEDLIRPLAEALGFDDVIATRYGAPGRPLRRHDRRRVRVGQGQGAVGRRVGVPARDRPGRSATPTATATTTCRCCRSSGTRGRSTPIRG